MDPSPLLRELVPSVLGSVVRRYRDFAACEDAVQEALIAAAQQWPREGLPDHPRAWLIEVAGRRLTDQIRAESARRRREEEGGAALISEDSGERDDSLQMLFLCCHPALTPSSAIALTLRAVGGLTTLEIARAFLVPEATMAQRISRAKQTIKDAPFPELQVAERLPAVTHVLYLIFNEGYAVSGGPGVVRTDLSAEAIRLTRLLRRLVPHDPEITGLLALMLLTDARRTARTGPAGELVPLDQQDRSQWDAAAIAEGVALLGEALPQRRPGPYQLQAAIAAVHDEAPTAEATDWPQILALYEVLLSLADHPLVALSHAIAHAMVHGPKAGLELLEALAPSHRVDAARGHLLERAGDRAGAAAAYRRAAEGTASTAERDYLLLRAAALA